MKKIRMLALHIFKILVLYGSTKLTQNYLSVTHHIYLQIISSVNWLEHLLFYTNTVQFANIIHTIPTNNDPNIVKL
jgi:hypothetical protein